MSASENWMGTARAVALKHSSGILDKSSFVLVYFRFFFQILGGEIGKSRQTLDFLCRVS
jgi:hypothetical protein